MTGLQKTARVLEGISQDQIPFDDLFAENGPVIMRGMIEHWPLVQAGRESAEKAMALLESGYSGKPTKVYVGDPEIKGNFRYNKAGTALNYRVETISVVDMFARIREGFGKEEHPYYYSPSLVFAEDFPGLQENNLQFDTQALGISSLLGKIWIGTETITGAHYDMPSNMACCIRGRRRFTLFPPNQIHNLYPGPFKPTPGGQVTTMVDLRNPDFETYPRFREALDAAVVADLEPGDVLYYPSMWWHEVEAKDPFNIMMNYWWFTSPRYMADPIDVLMHAILGLRDRPEKEKAAWREVFDYYIFGPADKPRAHLSEEVHGVLGELDETMARRLRATLAHTMNR